MCSIKCPSIPIINLGGWKYPPQVQLVDGSSALEGRVKILIHGEWRTVCTDFWKDIDATVVCRQLGHSAEGAEALKYTQLRGTIPVIDDVRCTGREAYITDCSHTGPWQYNCATYHDAGVRCQGEH